MHYRREIDGLRAVAVLPVILFHAGFAGFGGGFVGVDVFFVISGYLITAIIAADLDRGSFPLLRFYERRARRILPALFVVVACCLPAAWAWMLPSQLADLGRSIAAAMVFASNVLFWRQDDYWAPDVRDMPLIHSWSLGVEEQYYLLFPLVLLGLWRFGRRRVTGCIAVAALMSLVASVLATRTMPAAGFYLLPFRAWEILTGALCALTGAERRGNEGAAAIGLGSIVAAVVLFGKATPWPGYWALMPVGGAGLVLRYADAGTWTGRLLGAPPLVAIGLISYSAYLWHQPLFAFARLRSLMEPGSGTMFALAAVSLILAWLSWRFVEQPVRRRAVPASGRSMLGASVAAALVLALIGSVAVWRDGFPERGAANVEARLLASASLDPACEQFNDSPRCRTSNAPEVLLWDDSYAGHLAAGLQASEPGLALQQQTMSGCAPVLGLARLSPADRAPLEWSRQCIAFNDRVFAWLTVHPGVRYVVLSSAFQLSEGGLYGANGRSLAAGDHLGLIADRLRDTVRRVQVLGRKAVLVAPPPTSGANVGQCLAKAAFRGLPEGTCDFALAHPKRIALLQRLSRDVPVLSLDPMICPAGRCAPVQHGVLLYRDAGHLTREGSAYFGKTDRWMARVRGTAR